MMAEAFKPESVGDIPGALAEISRSPVFNAASIAAFEKNAFKLRALRVKDTHLPADQRRISGTYARDFTPEEEELTDDERAAGLEM